MEERVGGRGSREALLYTAEMDEMGSGDLRQ